MAEKTTVHIVGVWPSYTLEFMFDRGNGECMRVRGIPMPAPHAPLSDEAMNSLRWHYQALQQQLFGAFVLWTDDDGESDREATE